MEKSLQSLSHLRERSRGQLPAEQYDHPSSGRRRYRYSFSSSDPIHQRKGETPGFQGSGTTRHPKNRLDTTNEDHDDELSDSQTSVVTGCGKSEVPKRANSQKFHLERSPSRSASISWVSVISCLAMLLIGLVATRGTVKGFEVGSGSRYVTVPGVAASNAKPGTRAATFLDYSNQSTLDRTDMINTLNGSAFALVKWANCSQFLIRQWQSNHCLDLGGHIINQQRWNIHLNPVDFPDKDQLVGSLDRYADAIHRGRQLIWPTIHANEVGSADLLRHVFYLLLNAEDHLQMISRDNGVKSFWLWSWYQIPRTEQILHRLFRDLDTLLLSLLELIDKLDEAFSDCVSTGKRYPTRMRTAQSIVKTRLEQGGFFKTFWILGDLHQMIGLLEPTKSCLKNVEVSPENIQHSPEEIHEIVRSAREDFSIMRNNIKLAAENIPVFDFQLRSQLPDITEALRFVLDQLGSTREDWKADLDKNRQRQEDGGDRYTQALLEAAKKPLKLHWLTKNRY